MKNNEAFKARLITKGRITGKEHVVWLRAVLYQNKVYFSRHNQDADWFQNSLMNPDVKVEIDKSIFVGKAKMVIDENLSKKISELKYPGENRAKEKRVVLEISI